MRNNQGFTLIELMVVIAITAIISAITIPNVYSWVGTQRFNSAVRDIQATIESLRLAAVKENSDATIAFASGSNQYQSQVQKRGLPSANQPGPRTHRLPAGVTTGSTVNLQFNSRGTANSLGTVIVNGPNDLSLNVVVSMTGNSRIQ